MIDRPLDEIGKADIEALYSNSVSEGRSIDYKAVLPGKSDGDRKEFLADVSSFANASGGDLVFGVREEGGVPVELPGLPGIDPDQEILRLENMIRTGIEPRIPGVHTKVVDGFSGGPVLVLRVPGSWASPHMVTYRTASRFFTRSSAGKYQMDVGEIRSAFVLSEGLPSRIRMFRDDRLGKIIAGETPVALEPRPLLVLHVMPLASFTTPHHMDITRLDDLLKYLRPIGSGGWNQRLNIDGLVTFSGSRGPGARSRDYCQMFRSGRVESVNARIIHMNEGTGYIASVAYEVQIVEAMRDYLGALKQLDVPMPVIAVMSMVGVKGAFMYVPNVFAFGDPLPIDRDVLLLPDVIVEEYDCDVPAIMRPVFDAVWNACGYARSMNYDDDGVWNPR